jgi:hypothetical protein
VNPVALTLLGAGVVIVTGLLGWILRELIAQGQMLAVVRDQLIPENAPTMRETVNIHTAQLAVLNASNNRITEALGGTA